MLRLLIVFMLLLPKIASANYPITAERYKGIVHYSDNTQFIITEHTAILDGEFGLFNDEGDIVWLNQIR